MLVRFNVRNFLSFFGRKQSSSAEICSHEFSMLPGKIRLNPEHVFQNKKQNLLRLATIYGANASGKSNLVKALRFFRSTVIRGSLPVGAAEKYSKLSNDNRYKPSYFECEILIDDELYSYGFEYILYEGVLISEWLTRLSKDSEENLFYKDGKDDDYHFGSILEGNQALNIYQQGIKGGNTLFLYEMNNNKQGFYSNNPNLTVLKKVFEWVRKNLEIVSPNEPMEDASFLINSTSLSKVAELMNSFDTGIVSVTELKEDADKIFESLPPSLRKRLVQRIKSVIESSKRQNEPDVKLKEWSALLRSRNDILGFELDSNFELKVFSVRFEHENIGSDIHFRISEESDGTARLFELIEILLSEKNKTYIVDEIDRCMHPCLTYKFIQNFFEYTKNRMVQLIVTTHESRLMDFNLLRRDEIWFVEKDGTGNSNIYSLEEYNTRFDKKVDKAYLEGRYGGVPVFTTLFPVGDVRAGE